MIELTDICFGYEEGEDVFSSLSLNVEKNNPVLILADPSCGKTSLARLMIGSATKYFGARLSGNFRYDDIDLFSIDMDKRKNYVARSAQSTDESIIMPTVADEIAFALEERNLKRDDLVEELKRLLVLYDLEKYEDAETSELSGGEKRRLSLATLDAVNPRLFIYDEAFDELSLYWRKRLLEIIRKKEYSITLSSHYLKEFEGFYSAVYEIKDKKLVPYEKKDISFSFCVKKESSYNALSIENVKFSQIHKASKIKKEFDLDVRDMKIKRGEITLLTGENGSGKSTLSKIIVGLNKEDEGEIRIDGKSIGAKDRRKNVSYLFQNPFIQLYCPTVLDELKTVSGDMKRIEEASELFSIPLDGYIQELSFGKAKMVQAAIFYLLERPYTIFDELDSAISYNDMMRVLSLYLKKNVGILLISHDERIISAFNGIRYSLDKGTLHEL